MRSRSEVADYSWDFGTAVCIFNDDTFIEYTCDKYELCDLIGKEIVTDGGGDWVIDDYDLSYNSEGDLCRSMVDINYYNPYKEDLEALFTNLKMIK